MIRQDTINKALAHDTTQVTIKRPDNDSVVIPKTGIIFSGDTGSLKKERVELKQKVSVKDLIITDSVSLATKDTLIVRDIILAPAFNYNPPIDRFGFFKNGTKDISIKPAAFWQTETVSKKNPEVISHHLKRSEFNWTLFIGLLSIVLLMMLKAYYQKFLNQVVNTTVNIQLADKLLREKNIIVRRAFFMMNLNFVLLAGLFIMLLANYSQVRITKNYFLDFLIIEAGLVALLLLRILVLQLIGLIFEKHNAINEQIHSSYLINKNLGLILLPLVFTAVYTNPAISKIILISGLVIFTIATLYRIIRTFQIILRNGVLLFYAILYLCTLELLPLVLGSKILISLR